MIVVSDTSPLNYLLLIDAIGILPKLFDKVIVPKAVLTEMAHPRAPQVVRQWTMHLPTWITLVEPVVLLESTLSLDAGEAAAISLAKQKAAAAILIDERRGSRIALSEKLKTIATLSILEAASSAGYCDLVSTIAALRKTSIRIPDEAIEAALARDVERRRSR